MADVKVLMVGGRRCGKSTVLASMYAQLLDNAQLTKNFNVKHRRNVETTQVSLIRKQNDLISFMEQCRRDSSYLVDFNSDTSYSYYSFKIYKPHTVGNISFEFVDCPGECFDADNEAANAELMRNFSESDVFIIVVDTPYLMETGAGKSDEGKFRSVNLTPDITGLFDSLNFAEDWDYKKVIFVPVKCEKWADDLEAVSKKLKVFYKSLFDRFELHPQVSYCIIPALTAGGIVFSEFTKPQLYNMEPCARLGNTQRIRLKDGSYSDMKPGESPIEDTGFTDITPGFPYYSWFRNIGEYEPKNCDQILFHVLRFIVYKVMVNQQHSILPPWMRGLPSVNVMKQMIHSLENDKMLLDSGNGIQNIRKVENV